MPEGYEVRKIGQPWGGFHDRLSDAMVQWLNCVDKLTGPYALFNPNSSSWSAATLSRTDVHDKTKARMETGPIGEKVRVRGSNDQAEPRYAIRRVFQSLGPAVLQAGLTQLGVPYVWGDEDPKGGGSAGFDCSGLTKWCYAQVDVDLPHQSDAQRLAVTACSVAQAKPGDLLFWGDQGGGAPAHHVGMKFDDERVLDTEDVSNPVAVRRIDSVWIGKMPFAAGYVTAVTGAH